MMPLILILFSAIYLTLIFPFAFFRHDDWLILVNAVRYLPADWSFAWSPTLFYGDTEGPWFFRPFFKFFVFLCYRVFGYHYYGWLVTLLTFLLGALIFGYLTLWELTKSRSRSILFLILFAASAQIHLGSLVWVGEGMMNCPQIFLLAATTYFFCRGYDRSRGSLWLAILLYTLALGFKESSVLHSLFLALLCVIEPNFRLKRLRSHFWILLPYAAITAFYLVVRFSMPVNPHYFTQSSGELISKQILLMMGSPLLILFTWLLVGRRSIRTSDFLRSLKQRWPYLLFFGLAIAPYIGHGFFSPGWLLQPGFYFVMIFCLIVAASAESIPEYSFRRLGRRLGLTLGLFTFIPVTWFLVSNGWWQWNIGQRQFADFVATASNRVTGIIIFNCENPKYPNAKLNRVVGYDDSLNSLWLLHHEKLVPISVVHCLRFERDFAWQVKYSVGEKIFLRWDFPQFTKLDPSPFQFPETVSQNN